MSATAEDTVISTVPVTYDVPAGDALLRRKRLSVERSQLVLFVILTCQLMVTLDATVVNVALPQMQTALHLSSASLSWVLTGYTLTFGGLLLLGARAGDLLGRRRTFLFGIALFTLASLVGGFAVDGAMLLSSRALQGVGAALAAPASLSLLTTLFPEGKERLKALGLFTAVSVSGAAIGLIAGGLLTQYASWRWVLFVNVPIGAAVLAVGRAVLPETDRARGSFDLLGALTSVAGMGSLVYGFIRAASDGWGDTVTLGSFAAGVLLMTAFITVERTAAEPITPLRLFADASRSAANGSRGLVFAGMYGMFFFLSQFLQDGLHYSSLQTGLAFLPLPLGVFTMSQLTTKVLLRRLQPKVLMLTGIGLSTIGIALATQLTQTSGYGLLFVAMLLVGAGNGLSFITLTSAGLAGVPAKDAGAASGLVNVCQQLGGTLGLAVLVTVFSAASKSEAKHHVVGETTTATAQRLFLHGATTAFEVAVLFLASAFVLVAVFVRVPKGAAPVSTGPSMDH